MLAKNTKLKLNLRPPFDEALRRYEGVSLVRTGCRTDFYRRNM
jgi:hypothetical protein